ncbi:unnamed protein product [Didymodactylos carnosus]|uniref:HIT domain-containing protein n=1 Tax=Didymodactylos carnosus TaxID=1234261 RepID=A0A813WUF1_9BILA|nr:unnamed protein product [Didymodactylos carnosus]CAF1253206.1 unnamed protein product [Didymodactylos carnosus]CAF3649923.1 unnamed protein product [Didymodactylos carnosus]CAF4060282.1 unnamed protein product [Didymodactylos carnosus]
MSLAGASPSSATKRTADTNVTNGASAVKKGGGHWSTALTSAVEDESVQVYKDDLCTIINDKYPKAKHHMLAMPNEYIANLKSLTSAHVPLLKHMLQVGKETAMKLRKAGDSSDEFRYGYHAIPSLSLLHMHIISQDFKSDCLKTKKHWNSFTTSYFMDAEDVIDELQTHGQVQVDSAPFYRLLEQELTCHRCQGKFRTMPKLKEHIDQHR